MQEFDVDDETDLLLGAPSHDNVEIMESCRRNRLKRNTVRRWVVRDRAVGHFQRGWQWQIKTNVNRTVKLINVSFGDNNVIESRSKMKNEDSQSNLNKPTSKEDIPLISKSRGEPFFLRCDSLMPGRPLTQSFVLL